MGIKGFAPFAVAILIIFSVIAILLIPSILLTSLRMSLIADLDLSYKTNLADDILLEFLQWKPNYRYISELELKNFQKY